MIEIVLGVLIACLEIYRIWWRSPVKAKGGGNMQAAQPSVHMRWFVEKDKPRVLEIERQSFDSPWDAKDLSGCLAEKNVICMVVEVEGRIIGFFIFACCKGHIDIYNLAVAPEYRRHGIGRMIVERLKTKLGQQGRHRLLVTISEWNLAAQIFYRSCGFRAVKVLHHAFETSDQDGYLFEFARTPVQIHRESLCQGI